MLLDDNPSKINGPWRILLSKMGMWQSVLVYT